jgi:hypothetical protein
MSALGSVIGLLLLNSLRRNNAHDGQPAQGRVTCKSDGFTVHVR